MKHGKREGNIVANGALPESGKHSPDRSGNAFSAARKAMVRDYYSLLERHFGSLLHSDISPNFITLAALLVSMITAYSFSRGEFLIGGCFLFVAAVFDTLDGAIARTKGRTSLFGALLDSTLDRYSEFFVFSGLLVFFRNDWIFFFILLALLGSMMVSYIKARTQSLGQNRTVGLMQRPERLAVLFFGTILNPISPFIPAGSPDIILKTTLVLLAVLTNVTALRRLLEGKKDLESMGKTQ